MSDRKEETAKRLDEIELRLADLCDYLKVPGGYSALGHAEIKLYRQGHDRALSDQQGESK